MDFYSVLFAKQYDHCNDFYGDLFAKSLKRNEELPSEYKRIIGIKFDSGVYYKINDFRLRGNDTVRISFSAERACNVFGCYTNANALDNYSLYISTTSGSKYLRYGNGTYKSYMPTESLGNRFDTVITPTGSSGMPEDDTWTEKEFEASSDMCIGTTSPSATSAKLDGNIYGNFVVDGRFNGIPCERVSDGKIGYYDTYTKTFFAAVAGTPVSLGYA